MIAVRRTLFAAFTVGLGCSITLSESALAALAAVWLWRLRDPAVRRAQQWPLLVPVLAFAGASVVSALWSGHPVPSLESCKDLLLILALYVTVDALDGPEDAEWFLSMLGIVVAIAAAIGLLQVAVCRSANAVDVAAPAWLRPPTGLRVLDPVVNWVQRLLYHRCYRARGPFSIYMTLAGILSLVLLATLPRFLPGSRRSAWVLPLWLVMLPALVATYTRGAWLGFAGGVMSLLPATRRGRLALVSGLLLLGLALLAGPAHVRERFLSMGDPEEATVKERLYMWRSGVAMWREHPWLGRGPGGVKREFARFALPEAVKKRTGHVHNTPLQILVERGVLGLAAWVAIWAAFFAGAIARLRGLPPDAPASRALVLGSIAAITGFLIGGTSEYNFGDSEVVTLAWAIMAIPFAASRGVAVARDAALGTGAALPPALRTGTVRSTPGP